MNVDRKRIMGGFWNIVCGFPYQTILKCLLFPHFHHALSLLFNCLSFPFKKNSNWRLEAFLVGMPLKDLTCWRIAYKELWALFAMYYGIYSWIITIKDNIAKRRLRTFVIIEAAKKSLCATESWKLASGYHCYLGIFNIDSLGIFQHLRLLVRPVHTRFYVE